MLFIIEHTGSETADTLRDVSDKALMLRVGVQLDIFMKNFTFETDCASTMSCVVGASVSSNRVPLGGMRVV